MKRTFASRVQRFCSPCPGAWRAGARNASRWHPVDLRTFAADRAPRGVRCRAFVIWAGWTARTASSRRVLRTGRPIACRTLQWILRPGTSTSSWRLAPNSDSAEEGHRRRSRSSWPTCTIRSASGSSRASPRPGGNVTGLATLTVELAEARTSSCSRAVLPRLSTVAVLVNPANPAARRIRERG